jgi:hypothetical protein
MHAERQCIESRLGIPTGNPQPPSQLRVPSSASDMFRGDFCSKGKQEGLMETVLKTEAAKAAQ